MASTAPERGSQLGSAEGQPLFGRDAEWKRLREAIDHVRAGGFRCVFIEGEAGIGKTRLVEELIAEARRSGFTVLHGVAEELEQGRAFGPLADALRRCGDGLPSSGAALEQMLRSESQTSDLALVDAFVDLVEELALSRPTCVVVEDLHWADAVTVSALRAVGRRLAYLPILFAGTYRPHPQSKALARLINSATQEGAAEIHLIPLSDSDVARLVETLVGTSAGPRLRALVASARGNPLYVTEIGRAVLNEGDVEVIDGVADVATLQLPPTLRLTILRRISFLPSETLELLRRAAILGSSFPLDELLAFTGQQVEEALRLLDAAIEAKIVEAQENTISFRHDLIHESVYQDIPSPHRAAMHNDAARALRSAGAGLARVTEHVLRGLDIAIAEPFEDAIAFANEIRFKATPLAAAIYEKAIGLHGVPQERRLLAQQELLFPLISIGRIDDAERLSKEAIPRDDASGSSLRWAWVIAEAKMRTGRVVESIPTLKAIVDDPRVDDWTYYTVRALLAAAHMRASDAGSAEEHAMAVLEKGRRRDVRAIGALGDVATQDILIGCGLVSLAIVRLAQGRIAEAQAMADELVDIHRRVRTPFPIVFVIPAMVYLDADDLETAQELCRDGLRMDRETGVVGSGAPYGGLGALIAFHAGSWGEAEAESRLARELVIEGSDSTDVLFASHVALAQIEVRRGRLDEAGRLVAWMDDFLAERGPQWGMIPMAWTKARYLHATGRFDEALAVLGHAWNAYASVRFFSTRPVFADHLRMALEAGDRARAEQVAHEASEGARLAPEIRSAVAVSFHCRGLLDDDTESLIAAVEEYRKTSRAVELATAREDAAASLLRRGSTSEGKALLEEAIAFYEGVDAAYDIRRITAMMRAAGFRRGARGRRARPKTGWEALTETERQVASLTVEGLTNPQIAERLFISRHTVQTHLSHVFAKLGVSSRSALAAVAAEHGGTVRQG